MPDHSGKVATATTTAPLTLKVLGEVTLERGGMPVALPQSRKTRALLAYLAVTGKRHRRERLCETFWDIPDDPRGALRWSLSKLRGLVDDPECARIVADRETVAFAPANAEIDLLAVRAAASGGLGALATDELKALAHAFRGEFLEGLDLPSCEIFNAWCVAERDEARALRIGILRELAARLAAKPEEARPYLRALAELEGGSGTAQSPREEHSVAPAAAAAPWRPDDPPPLPDIPSIAVLNFTALSDVRAHHHFAEGLAEDILTLLARIPGFFVIARGSSFGYGPDYDIAQIGRELGVRYVVQGSLRPAGDQIRLSVRLSDAATRAQIWADRFDSSIDVLSDLDDEIANAIVANIEPALTRAEIGHTGRRRTDDLDAWALYHRAAGVTAVKGYNDDSTREAARLLRRAIDATPDFALAIAHLSLLLAIRSVFGVGVYDTDEVAEAMSLANRALDLEGHDSAVLGFAGCALCDLGNSLHGSEVLLRAIELNPSNAQAWVALGAERVRGGKMEEAADALRRGIRLSPRDQRLGLWRSLYALTLAYLGRLDEALEQARAACRAGGRTFSPSITLAAILEMKGRHGEGIEALREARHVAPHLTRDDVPRILGTEIAATIGRIWDDAG